MSSLVMVVVGTFLWAILPCHGHSARPYMWSFLAPWLLLPNDALVLSGLANSRLGNFSLIRFQKGQTLCSRELHFDRRSTLTPEISLLPKSCQNPTFSFQVFLPATAAQKIASGKWRQLQ